jgi:hypothetical protein
VIQVIVVAERGSELSQIWTASNGIPNPDLEGSGELRALCSTRRSGSGTRVASLARRLYPKVGPVIVRAADVPRLSPKVIWREDSSPSQGYQSAYCIG